MVVSQVNKTENHLSLPFVTIGVLSAFSIVSSTTREQLSDTARTKWLPAYVRMYVHTTLVRELGGLQSKVVVFNKSLDTLLACLAALPWCVVHGKA